MYFNCVSLKLAVTQMFWLSSGTMVIICWPGTTFWPGWTDRCPTIPLTGATIVVYCRFSCACSQNRGRAFGFRFGGMRARPLHRYLLRLSLGVLQFRLSLRDPGASLSDSLFRGGGGCAGGIDGSGRGLLAIDCLRVCLLRDLVLRRERLVPVHVVLGLQVIGLGLLQRGLGGVKSLLGANQAGVGVFDVGLGGGELARSVYGSDGNARLLGRGAGLIVGQSRLGIGDGDLVILRIELREYGAGLDELIVVDRNANHVA